MTQKTPVTILQELMVKNKKTLEFSLICKSDETHNPIFQFMVRADPITANGTGRSKKAAKHDAAKNALKKLSELGLYNENGDSCGTSSTNSSKTMQANYIGQLSDFCIKKRLPHPNFELLTDFGPLHARQFTMNCSVGAIECSASSSTKKSAKHLASKKMIDILIKANVDMITPSKNLTDIDMKAVEKRNEIIASTAINLNRKIVDESRSLLELDESLRLKAGKILDNIDITDLVGQMRLALDALEIKYEFKNISCENPNNFGSTIQLFSDPPFELAAIETSAAEVERQLAIKTINFLKIMLKTNQ